MSSDYVSRNEESRRRLEQACEGLTREDLERRLPNGWSVAVALFHLAFWDRYALSLVDNWGTGEPAPYPSNADALNDALECILALIPMRAAPNLALEAAAAVDSRIEALDGDVAADIEGRGFTRLLFRNLHREDHLAHLEEAIRKAGQ